MLHRRVWEQVCACVCMHTCVYTCTPVCPAAPLGGSSLLSGGPAYEGRRPAAVWVERVERSWHFWSICPRVALVPSLCVMVAGACARPH